MMFNSPLEFCPVCKAYVALDRTRSECRAEHRCSAVACPLAKLFEAVASAAAREATASTPA